MDTPTPVAEVALPSSEALLAATLALMTAYAGPAPAHCRWLVACKVTAHLGTLRERPELSPGLRQVLGAAHRHWQALLEAPGTLH